METREETSERKGKERNQERGKEYIKNRRKKRKKRMKIKPSSIIYENQIYYIVFILSDHVQFTVIC
jgi:hypothetical protein